VYYGYGDMAKYLFLQLGVIWVLGCGFGFCGAFMVGKSRGGRAAERFVRVTMIVFWVGIAGIVGYSLISGELIRFLRTYGFGPIIEMLLLAAGDIFIMWFMGKQYANSRIAIDEKFGSKEAFDAAKAEAKRAGQEAYEKALRGTVSRFRVSENFDGTNDTDGLDPRVKPEDDTVGVEDDVVGSENSMVEVESGE
jgi:hypothetical protein